jgi:hypothetical protein
MFSCLSPQRSLFCVRLNLAATSSQSRDSHRNDATAAALLDH